MPVVAVQRLILETKKIGIEGGEDSRRPIAPSWRAVHNAGMDERSLRNPHDRFFYFSFSETDVARACIVKELPAEDIDCLDLDTLKLAAGSFIDANLSRSHSDLVYTCQIRGGEKSGDIPKEAMIFFLFEHKSYPDPMTAAQVLGYVMRVLQRRLRDGELPCCVIPIVVYHGEMPWNVAKTMDELIQAPEPLKKYVPQLSYVLFDVNRTNDDHFQDKSFLHAALLMLKYARSSELGQNLGRILELLKMIPNDVRELNRLEAVLVYILTAATKLSREDLTVALKKSFPQQGQALMSTIAEQLIEQGIEQGIETGLRKGTLIGTIRTCQSILGLEQSEAELKEQPLEQLEEIANRLQQLVRERLNRQ